jgi:hypothetical protein
MRLTVTVTTKGPLASVRVSISRLLISFSEKHRSRLVCPRSHHTSRLSQRQLQCCNLHLHPRIACASVWCDRLAPRSSLLAPCILASHYRHPRLNSSSPSCSDM